MTVLRKIIGANLKKIRKSRHLTQAQLAEKIGIEPVSVARIETGINFPKEENLTAIAEALNVKVLDFFNTQEQETLARETALNFIHFNINYLNDRDLNVLCSAIKAMLYYQSK